MKKIYLIILTIMSLTLFGQDAFYVKKGGTGDGSSWDHAMSELPTTIFNGLVTNRPLKNIRIYIAEGEYDFNNVYTYLGQEVIIQGGFPNSASGTDLSGYNPDAYISRIIKLANRRFIEINSTTGTYDSNKITVKGLYFKSTGIATTPGNVINQEGLVAKYVQLKVEDCVFHDSRSGSGMIRISNSDAGKVSHWIHNNKFHRNIMGATGGFEYTSVNGDAKILVSNNLFGEGTSTNGTGFYVSKSGNSTTSLARFYIIGNIFSCGTGGSTTGGVYLANAGNVVIKNNVFLGVQAKNYGGAIYADNVGGLNIEDNFFIQNSTYYNSLGGGGAIAIEAITSLGTIIKSNHIKNNVFYENSMNTVTGGGAISFRGTVPTSLRISARYDIIGNLFAYNKSTRDNGVIMVMAGKVGKIDGNIFHGNANDLREIDKFSEIRADSLSSINQITNNKFQLANAEAYAESAIFSRIKSGVGNTFGSTENDIMNLKPNDFQIDCYSGGVGCFKVDEAQKAIAQISQVGISTFKNQSQGWPTKDEDDNPVYNGAIVLESNGLPLVVTRVNNPAKIIGNDPVLKGALAYDTDRQCMMLFDGDKWGCLTKSCDISIHDVLENIKNIIKP